MSKEDEVRSAGRLFLRNREPPPKGSLLTHCLVHFLQYFAQGLVFGAVTLLYSFYQIGERARYLHWMSGAIIIVFASAGLLKASCIAVRYRMSKNRDTLN